MTLELTHPGRGLLLVTMEVEEEFEDELNAWYDEEHLPERKACPGFLSAHRYRLAEGSSPHQATYLAIYELESPDVLETTEYLALVPPTKRWQALLPHVKVVRNIYTEITREVPADFVLDTDR
ncbi:MAG: DUF4286 family protein [Acidimicrobiaceae bacterium]|nr:DUF4286 family protein [Acidimicrobiaceae bacterium]